MGAPFNLMDRNRINQQSGLQSEEGLPYFKPNMTSISRNANSIEHFGDRKKSMRVTITPRIT